MNDSRRKLTDHQIALFAAEVILGLGHTISLKWVIEGKLNSGTFCTVQGALINYLRGRSEMYDLTVLSGLLRQLGDVGVALATLVRDWSQTPTCAFYRGKLTSL
jgi:hypothetical protein